MNTMNTINTINTDYKKKYLKYKSKYLNLKGGNNLPNLRFDADGLLIYQTTRRNIVPFQKLQIEIITSFFVTYIGYYMQDIVNNLNRHFGINILVSNTLSEIEFFRKNKNHELNNTLVPVGEDFVHWVYVGNNGYVHNPYDYNMQILNSHQFCQTHALLLAYEPNYRVNTTPQQAYYKVVQFWNFVLDNTIKIDQVAHVVNELRMANVSENQNWVDAIIEYYLQPNFNFEQIKLLISSDLAKQLAPDFK